MILEGMLSPSVMSGGEILLNDLPRKSTLYAVRFNLSINEAPTGNINSFIDGRRSRRIALVLAMTNESKI